MRVILFFGSFNPVHIGHLIIANQILNFSNQDQVWLVCTPQNPDKEKKTLLNEQFRLEMLHLATADHPHIRPSDIEFYLPRPSYTVNTLIHIREKYSQHQFSILLGEDNLQSLHNWHNYEYILEKFPIFVYPRVTNSLVFENNPLANRVHYLKDLPILQISASFIRDCIKENKSIQYIVPKVVGEYIEKMGFYKNK